MTSIQDRLKSKQRESRDTWSTREQLCLASSVLKSGDQNWISVSRSLKPFAEKEALRPPDWFSHKSCANQYTRLLENVDTPKRKKRESGETIGESIVKRLTQERTAELGQILAFQRDEYQQLKAEYNLLKSGSISDDKLQKMWLAIEQEEREQEQKAKAHSLWLAKRQQKQDLASQLSTTPLKKTLEISNEAQEEAANEEEEKKRGCSTLLTNLLKAPSPTKQIQNTTSTAQVTSPTITSLLNSNSGVHVVTSAPQNVIAPIHQIVTSVIPSETPERPSAGAPTLSMLLALPANLPKGSLPTLPVTKNETETAARSATPKSVNQTPRIQVSNAETEITGADNVGEIIERIDDVIGKDKLPDVIDKDEINEIMEDIEELIKEEITKSPQTEPTPVVTETFPVVEKMEERVEAKVEKPISLTDSPESEMAIEEIDHSTSNIAEIIGTSIETPKVEEKKEDYSESKVEEEVNSKIEEEEKPIEEERKCEEEMAVDEEEKIEESEEKVDEEKFEERKEEEEIKEEEKEQKIEEVEQKEEEEEKKCEEVSEMKEEVAEPEEKKSEVEEESKEAEEESKEVEDETKEEKLEETVQEKNEEKAEVEEETKDDEEKEIEVKEDESEEKVEDKKSEVEEVKKEKVTEAEKEEEKTVEVKGEEKNEKKEKEEEQEIKDVDDKKEEKKEEEEMEVKVETNEKDKEETKTVDETFPEKIEEDKSEVDEKITEDDIKVENEESAKEEEAEESFEEPKEEKQEKEEDEEKEEKEEVSENKEEDKDKVEKMEKEEETETKEPEEVEVKKEESVSLPENQEVEEESSLIKLSGGRAMKTYSKKQNVAVDRDSESDNIGEEGDYRNWKKAVLLVYQRFTQHKYASLFLRPITEDQAPGYHSVIFRPMDLSTIKKNIENGTIRSTMHFQRDVMLMFQNALMYNKQNNYIYKMAMAMQEDCLQEFQMLVGVTKDVSFRRETRTAGSSNSDFNESNILKRKRSHITPSPHDSESPRLKKRRKSEND